MTNNSRTKRKKTKLFSVNSSFHFIFSQKKKTRQKVCSFSRASTGFFPPKKEQKRFRKTYQQKESLFIAHSLTLSSIINRLYFFIFPTKKYIFGQLEKSFREKCIFETIFFFVCLFKVVSNNIQ